MIKSLKEEKEQYNNKVILRCYWKKKELYLGEGLA
jgi:hypothetical protein